MSNYVAQQDLVQRKCIRIKTVPVHGAIPINGFAKAIPEVTMQAFGDWGVIIVDRIELSKTNLVEKEPADASSSLLDDAMDFVRNHKYEAGVAVVLGVVGGTALALRKINQAAEFPFGAVTSSMEQHAIYPAAILDRVSADLIKFGERSTKLSEGIRRHELAHMQANPSSIGEVKDLFIARAQLATPEGQHLAATGAFSRYIERTHGDLAAETRMWIDATKTLGSKATIDDFARATLASTGKVHGFNSQNFAELAGAWQHFGVKPL